MKQKAKLSVWRREECMLIPNMLLKLSLSDKVKDQTLWRWNQEGQKLMRHISAQECDSAGVW